MGAFPFLADVNCHLTDSRLPSRAQVCSVDGSMDFSKDFSGSMDCSVKKPRSKIFIFRGVVGVSISDLYTS